MLKNTAVFAQMPKTAQVAVTTAIALTGTDSLATDTCANTSLLMTAGADGAIVTRLALQPRGTVSACNAYLFVRRAGDGANIRRLIDSAAIAAKTASTTTPPTVQTMSITVNETTPLRLGAGDELHVGLSVAQSVGVSFFAEYTDF